MTPSPALHDRPPAVGAAENPRRRPRALGVALVAGLCLATASLTACSGLPWHHRGQSTRDAEAAAQQIDGVVGADVTTEMRGTDPFHAARLVEIDLTVDEDHVLADPTGLLRWTLWTAWSLQDGPPGYAIGVLVTYPDGSPVDVDWEQAVRGLPGDWTGWTGDVKQRADGSYGPDNSLPAAFNVDRSRQVVTADWPVDPPAVPTHAFVLRGTG